MAAILLICGAALLTVGAAFIYWPAAFVIAGVLCLALAALLDLSDVPVSHDSREEVE